MQGEILAGAKPLVRVGRNASRLPGEDGLPRRPVPTNGHRVGVQGSGIADDSSVMTAWRWNGRRTVIRTAARSFVGPGETHSPKR